MIFNPLFKFLILYISLFYYEATISGPGIIYGAIWKSFPVPGLRAICILAI